MKRANEGRGGLVLVHEVLLLFIGILLALLPSVPFRRDDFECTHLAWFILFYMLELEDFS